MLYNGAMGDTGASYEKGLLGRLISPSHIPSLEIGPFDFFDRTSNLTQSEVSHRISTCTALFGIFLSKNSVGLISKAEHMEPHEATLGTPRYSLRNYFQAFCQRPERENCVFKLVWPLPRM